MLSYLLEMKNYIQYICDTLNVPVDTVFSPHNGHMSDTSFSLSETISSTLFIIQRKQTIYTT